MASDSSEPSTTWRAVIANLLAPGTPPASLESCGKRLRPRSRHCGDSVLCRPGLRRLPDRCRSRDVRASAGLGGRHAVPSETPAAAERAVGFARRPRSARTPTIGVLSFRAPGRWIRPPGDVPEARHNLVVTGANPGFRPLCRQFLTPCVQRASRSGWVASVLPPTCKACRARSVRCCTVSWQCSCGPRPGAWWAVRPRRRRPTRDRQSARPAG